MYVNKGENAFELGGLVQRSALILNDMLTTQLVNVPIFMVHI